MATKKWADIKKQHSTPETIAVGEARARETLRHLRDLRKARGLTQVTLAETMEATQGQIAKIEHQADLYISTLRRFIEAMGGELLLVAQFPDGEEVGVQLADVDEDEVVPKPRALASASR